MDRSNIFSGLIASVLSALATWFSGYEISHVALTCLATGILAATLTALLTRVFYLTSQWWWARSIDFRFYTIFGQSAALAVFGLVSVAVSLSGNGFGVGLLGVAFLLGSPIWLSIALDSILGRSEPPDLQDYL